MFDPSTDEQFYALAIMTVLEETRDLIQTSTLGIATTDEPGDTKDDFPRKAN